MVETVTRVDSRVYEIITYQFSLVLHNARIGEQSQETSKEMKKTKIVIAGGGFAGLAAQPISIDDSLAGLI